MYDIEEEMTICPNCHKNIFIYELKEINGSEVCEKCNTKFLDHKKRFKEWLKDFREKNKLK